MVMFNTQAPDNQYWIEGIFRIKKTIRVAFDGFSRTDAILVSEKGAFRCEEWNRQFSGPKYNNQLFRCVLQPGRKQSGRAYTRLSHAEPIKHLNWNEFKAIAGIHLPLPDTLQQLSVIVDHLPHPALKRFILNSLEETKISIPFFMLPASRDYHHAYKGGLAEHSLETAQIARTALMNPSDNDIALIVSAAIFHDIGKVLTLNEDGSKTTLGRVMRHEQLTLEILAEPLRLLSQEWPDGATALRYLLTYTPEQIKRPLLPCALALHYADRMSTSLSARKKAMEYSQNKPFISTQARGPKSWFWIPN